MGGVSIHAELCEMLLNLACEKKVSMTEGVTSAATPRVLKTMADLIKWLLGVVVD